MVSSELEEWSHREGDNVEEDKRQRDELNSLKRSILLVCHDALNGSSPIDRPVQL